MAHLPLISSKYRPLSEASDFVVKMGKAGEILTRIVATPTRFTVWPIHALGSPNQSKSSNNEIGKEEERIEWPTTNGRLSLSSNTIKPSTRDLQSEASPIEHFRTGR